MCGIAGVLYTNGARARREDVEPMIAALDHRGPDGTGVHLDGPLGIGHARLAIIDLAGGEQPLANEDEDVWVTFNGEIYNHHELRAELSDHRFRTRCDTEVLVHGYEEWGPALVDRLAGFFAFALWDAKRERLVLARDRLGKKPLFLARLADRILFASEPAALLSVWPGSPEVDPVGLNDLLAVRHPVARGGGGTCLRGVEQLLPGERAVVAGGEIERERFWSPPPPTEEITDEAEAIERFRTLFDQAVHARLEADVPLGLMLSGGIDSTAVLESMARAASEPVKTFTVAFTRQKESEADQARRTAAAYGAVHEEFLLDEKDLIEEVQALLPRLDLPMADPSILPTALISRVARQRVTVCLTGDGGDELFGGYVRYPRTSALPVDAPASGLERVLYSGLAERLPHYALKGWKLRRGMHRRLASRELRYLESIGCVDVAGRTRLMGPHARDEVDVGAVEALLADELSGDEDFEARMMALDLRHELPGLILWKVDRASMLSSLEVRSPFLDHRLVEWSQSVSPRLKIRGEETKWLVKRALEGRVPEGLLDRPKMGFGTPLGRWFRRELADYVNDHLGSSRLARDGYLDQRELERLLGAHRRRSRNLGEPLWVLLSAEVWYRTWVRSS